MCDNCQAGGTQVHDRWVFHDTQGTRGYYRGKMAMRLCLTCGRSSHTLSCLPNHDIVSVGYKARVPRKGQRKHWKAFLQRWGIPLDRVKFL